jgi:hypothetical protein
VLLIGVEGDRYVINDPYDYGNNNPYVKLGARTPQPRQYVVEQAAVRQSLGWVESIVVRKDGVHLAPPTRCMAKGQSCPSPPSIVVGNACSCGTAAGVVIRVR